MQQEWPTSRSRSTSTSSSAMRACCPGQRWPSFAHVFLMFILVICCSGILLRAEEALAASSKGIPKPTAAFYVNDFADMLSEGLERDIRLWGETARVDTKAQVVVVTISSLKGRPLEEYALELARAWGVGDKEKDSGIVLLVAKEERKARIEVGYGLEGAIPDGKAGRILDEQLIPSFKEGRFDEGIGLAYKSILAEVYTEYGSGDVPEDFADSRLSEAAPQTSGIEASETAKAFGFFIVVILLIFLRIKYPRFFKSVILSGWRGGGGKGGGGNSGGGGGFGGGGSSRGW